MRAAAFKRVILADMPIMVAGPGRAGGGGTRPTTGAMAGGGTSGASGISIRNGSRDRQLMCLTSRSWRILMVRMDRPLWPVIPRRRAGSLCATAAAATAAGPRSRRGRWRNCRWTVGRAAHGPAERSGCRRDHRRHDGRHLRRPGRPASRLLSRARQLLFPISLRSSTFRSIRAVAIERRQIGRDKVIADQRT